MHTGNVNPCASFGNLAQFILILFLVFFWLNVSKLHRGGSQSQCLIRSISFERCNPYFGSKHVLLYMYSKRNSRNLKKTMHLEDFC